MKLSNKAYDTLKAIFEILVLLATFWVDISTAWNLPYTEPIQKTLMAASAVILGILKISTAKYNKDLADIDIDDLEGAEENEVGLG